VVSVYAPGVAHPDGLRVVIDTNVVISALLKPGSVPDRVMAWLWADRSATVVYDARIEDEYREVAMRPKFRAMLPGRLEALLASLRARGELVTAVPAWGGAMTHENDRLFVEVALAGRAHAIVTGNLKHYPSDLGVDVQPPASLLAMLG
jgi:putative PIN family toxin of toxin-antitoxin system